MNKQFAVIILNYFGAEDTVNCINSVKKKLDASIFLVDNSAEPNEREKLRLRFQKEKKIHMLFPVNNLGFAAGVNLAIDAAVKRGFKRFLLLNNDAILLNGAETQLEKAFDQWPKALIAPTIKWGKRINKGNYYHKYLGLIVNDRIPKSEKWLYYFTGCALAFDLGFLNKVGYLDEKFFMYGEDIELSFRAGKKDVPIILIKDVIVYHKGSHSAGMASFFYEYHMARMQYLLSFDLLKSPLEKTVSILVKIFVLALRASIRCIRYKNFAPIKALILAPLPLKIRPEPRRQF